MNAPSPKPICDTDPSRRGGIDLNAVTQADDGWIEWSSKGKPYGSMPVAHGVLVDVLYRDRGTCLGVAAGEDTGPCWRDAETRFWNQERHHSDIIAYRVVRS